MKKSSRIAVLAGLLLACQSEGSGSGSGDGAAEEAPRGQRVETELVDAQRFVERIDVNATVVTDGDVTLSARASGTLERLAVLGAEVASGELVAQLDPALARAALAQAEAAQKQAAARARLARSRYERQKPLMDRDVISATEFEGLEAELAQAEANVAQAEASVQQAREQLRLTHFIAPRDGVIEERFAEVGEQVGVGTPVLRLVDLDEVRVRGAVPERYAKDIEVGDPAEVRFQAYELGARTAEISFVGQSLDPRSRTFAVEVRLDNTQRKLKPEMVARMVLERASIENAIAVPQTSIVTDEIGAALFVVEEEDGRAIARRRRVQTGARSEGRVVISEGLEVGEEVVVVGQATLSGGELVEVVSGR